MPQDESDMFVLPVKHTRFFIFTTTFSGILMSQVFISKAVVSLSLLWSCFLLAGCIQLLYVLFLLYVAYRGMNEKPIEPFVFLQQDKVVDEDESDFIS